MALRNAFGEMALEQTLRSILRAVSFARDSADRMRVIVEGNPQVTVYNNNSSTSNVAGTTQAPHAISTWNSVDARAEMQEFSLNNFQNTRARWTIT